MFPRNTINLLLKEHLSSMSTSDKIEIVNTVLMDLPSHSNIVITDGNNIKLIEVNKILYLYKPKKKIFIIQMQDQIVEYNSTDGDLLDKIEIANENMFYLNHDLLVNIDKIVAYDSFLHKVYFSENTFVSVTGVAINKIVKKHIRDKQLDMGQYTQIGLPIRFPILNDT